MKQGMKALLQRRNLHCVIQADEYMKQQEKTGKFLAADNLGYGSAIRENTKKMALAQALVLFNKRNDIITRNHPPDKPPIYSDPFNPNWQKAGWKRHINNALDTGKIHVKFTHSELEFMRTGVYPTE